MNKRIKSSLFSLLIIMIFGGQLIAQDGPESYIQKWLFNSCEVGEEGQLKETIKKFGSDIQPQFIEAFEKGPDPQQVERQEAYYQRTYQTTRQVLEQGKKEVYPEAWLKEAKNETSDRYVERRMKQFVLEYKSNAIYGIGLVADEEGKEYLRSLLSEENTAFTYALEMVLKE